jgi:hypothetical protein
MTTRSRRRRGRRPPALTVPQVLAWADAHHERTGKWPQSESGFIREATADKWRNVDNALRYGLRGLPGHSSLARLLAEQRQVRNRGSLPPLLPKQILAWADAYHRRTGAWPTGESGPVAEAPGETWRAVDQALRVGVRGLPGGSSLARLLEQRRKVRNIQHLPSLTVPQILAWADAHHRRTGTWPTNESGPVVGAPGETWKGVAAALAIGRRGLPGGSSLPRLLATHRDVRNPRGLPPFTLKQVRAWAHAHRRRTGEWPTRYSGPIPEAPGETWSAVNAALTTGCRGLRAGLSLRRLLTGQPDVVTETRPPRLRVEKILSWADAYHGRTGAWPTARSGHIEEVPGETWRLVDQALRQGQRGLPGGSTLAQLLSARRGVRMRPYLPDLKESDILAWAEAHRRRTGVWPTSKSGPIPGTAGETWRGVDDALRKGRRGMRGRRSLAGLLARKLEARNRTSLPPLTEKKVLAWADAHRRRTGAWPTSASGPVLDAPGETWKGLNEALRNAYRGLPGGITLAHLLARDRGVRNRTNLPDLSGRQIRSWARAHHRRTGRWPTRASGPIPGTGGETWASVANALICGHRGLAGGSSLARLLGDLSGSRAVDGRRRKS